MDQLKPILIFVFSAGIIIYFAPSVVNLTANLTNLNINLEDGILYISKDNGENFIKMDNGLGLNNINQLAFDNNNKIYALTNTGVYFLDEKIEKWKKIIDETKTLTGVVKIYDFIQTKNDTILISVFKNDFGRIYRSDDNFKTLKEVYITPEKNYLITGLAYDQNRDIVYFVSNDGILGFSNDNGLTFSVRKHLNVPLKKIILNGENALYLLSDNDIYRSHNNGFYFEKLTSPKLFYYDLAVINGDLYLGTQNGAYYSSNGYFWQKLDSLLPKNSPCFKIGYNNKSGELMLAFDGRIYFSSDKNYWKVRSLAKNYKINQIKIYPVNSNNIFVGLIR